MRKVFGTAVLAVLAVTLAPSSPLDAQGRALAPARPEPTSAPGWVFTPAISASESWDNNVLLATEDSGVAADFLTSVSPRAGLGYRGRYTTLRLNYEGSYHLYQDLTSLNAFEQRLGVDLRQRVSRHVSLFARDGLTRTPTTDDVDLPGIRFRRQGVILDDLRAGVEAQFSPRTSLNAAYTFQWLDFAAGSNDLTVPSDEFHQGGHSHGVSASFQHRLQKTIGLGAEFDMRHATLETRDVRAIDGTRQFDVQSALGTVDLRLNEHYNLSGGAGLAWLSTTETGENRRTAPAFRIALDRAGQHWAWSVAYRRSFLPSFGFGGTFQNEELMGNVFAPLSRRLDWSAGLAFRRNEPLTGDLPPLQSLWTRSSVSYLATRWMRIEGYYSQAIQSSQVAGGRVDRTRAGVQVVTSTRMRIR